MLWPGESEHKPSLIPSSNDKGIMNEKIKNAQDEIDVTMELHDVRF